MRTRTVEWWVVKDAGYSEPEWWKQSGSRRGAERAMQQIEKQEVGEFGVARVVMSLVKRGKKKGVPR